ncbi:hypothetical protein [Helicobacter pylori]|uniref:hypothetical protein n=1 Tax=Helicobacter pylori TaxID=210 RepID=UPI001A93C064|nr:hypothetical protein [Helicobacter pylori]
MHRLFAEKQTPTSEALASIQAVLHRLFAEKQTPTSEALASMDKSALQFESVGVSRSCFCASKIKQDSANLALA